MTTLAVSRGIELLAQEASAATCDGGQLDTFPATTWNTRILAPADDLRPKAPVEPTANELAERVTLPANRDDTTSALIQQWNNQT